MMASLITSRAMIALLVLGLAGSATSAWAKELPSRAAGWRASGKAETYDTKTVYQAINGAAEIYLAYGMRTLRQREYRRGKLRVAVQVYDLGAAINAFGIFTRERPRKAPALGAPGSVGAAAALVGGVQCLAYHGSLYVKAQAHAGELTAKTCGPLLGSVLKALGAKGSGRPAELKWLPSGDRAPGSVSYTPSSYLGLRELRGCLHGAYGQKGGKHKGYQLFLIVGSADEVWRGLVKRWKVVGQGRPAMRERVVPYRGTVTVARSADGKRIYGVVGMPAAAARARLKAILATR